MTNKFDPNATPETDKFEKDGGGKPWVPWNYLREMERDMRIAKKRLIMAIEALHTSRRSFEQLMLDDAEDIEQTLRDIESVHR
jgi:hypothetical protein